MYDQVKCNRPGLWKSVWTACIPFSGILDIAGYLIALYSGDVIRDLLLKHGNFNAVEIEVAKISRQTASNKLEGGWHNEISLAKIKFWDE